MSKSRSKQPSPQPAAAAEAGADATVPAAEPNAPFRAGGQAGPLYDLLTREGGASVEEMVAATGWLNHMTRAPLTGLRKRGHAVEKEQLDGVTRYRIARSA